MLHPFSRNPPLYPFQMVASNNCINKSYPDTSLPHPSPHIPIGGLSVSPTVNVIPKEFQSCMIQDRKVANSSAFRWIRTPIHPLARFCLHLHHTVDHFIVILGSIIQQNGK